MCERFLALPGGAPSKRDPYKEGSAVVQTEQLKVILAVSVWVASAMVVGGYLYFSGRVGAYLKQVYPDVWKTSRNSDLSVPGLTRFDRAWPAWRVQRGMMKSIRSLHDPELDRLANIANNFALGCMIAILASFGAVYLLPELPVPSLKLTVGILASIMVIAALLLSAIDKGKFKSNESDEGSDMGKAAHPQRANDKPKMR
jgi:hypothetical protein